MSLKSDYEKILSITQKEQNKGKFFWWSLLLLYMFWASGLYKESAFYFGLIIFLFLRARRP